jgi:multidrug resistance efflux pump
MQLLEYEKKLAETESNSNKLSAEVAQMSKIISESSSKKSAHQNNNNDRSEQDILQGNILFKQKQFTQSNTVNGEQESGKNFSSTAAELHNKINRIESQIANLERGVIKVEERVDGIDARMEQLETINERTRSVSLLVLSYVLNFILCCVFP